MRQRSQLLSFIVITLLLMAGCASYRAQKIVPTPIHQAKSEIPEDQLLDVGIQVFESEEYTEKEAQKEGSSPQIRKAESHFIPYHLKNTLHQGGYWGAISVVPFPSNSIDLLVRGTIHESNGERLLLEVHVTDASGKTWFAKSYIAEANKFSYIGNKPGEQDAFQDLYDTVANDMAAFKTSLSPEEIKTIRMVSTLKFAQDLAPEAFLHHLKKEKNDQLSINRLPAGNDAMLARVLKIREREYMYLDTLNQYYDSFYNRIWQDYENWRSTNLTEQQALKKIKKEALTRKLIGALLIIGAIAAASSDSSTAVNISPAIAIIGGQVIIDGFNVSKQAEIHSAAIEELSESFGSQMEPVMMEFQGKQYELKGSAEEQFAAWRELLKKIYAAETGFLDGPSTHEGDEEAESR